MSPTGGSVSVSILVVDDEPDVADLFRQRFRREARDGTCVLYFATSGHEALDRIPEIRPELIVVLSDINMPGMDGLALLREIKRRRPDLPVMMVTAYGDDERRRRATEDGAASFLTKPVDFDALKERLRRLPSASAKCGMAIWISTIGRAGVSKSASGEKQRWAATGWTSAPDPMADMASPANGLSIRSSPPFLL